MIAKNPTKTLHVACIQPLAVPGDVPENIRRMEPLIAEAARRGARLILTSEAAVTGYDLDGVGQRAAIMPDDPAFATLANAARCREVDIVAGFWEKAKDGEHNSAMVLHADGRRTLQRKLGDGSKGFLAGPRERTIFEVDGLRCAILICSDNGMPDIYPELAAQSVDLVLLPTAGMGRVAGAFRQDELKDISRRGEYLAKMEQVCFVKDAVKQCLELDMALAACNQSGFVEETGFFHPGHSSIVDRTGELVAVLPGSFVPTHLRPKLIDGVITARARR